MKKKISILTAIFIIVFVVIFFDKIIDFAINIKWFKEVGYINIYFTRIIAMLKLMVPIFLVCFFVIWLYYKSLRISIDKWKKVVEVDVNKHKKNIERIIFLCINFIVSILISYGFSSSYWYRVLQFKNSSNFNVQDPIFNKDVSFYVFKLPLIESLYKIAMSLLLFLVVITLIVYFTLNAVDKVHSGGIKAMTGMRNFKSGITKFAGRQLAIVSSLIMLCLSLGYLVKSWNLVYSPRGVVFGASYTDVNVSLKFYYVIIVVSLFASIVIFLSVLASKVKPIIISLGTILILMVGENVAASIVENFVVKSNQKTLENTYIKYNIDYTRKAFGLDNIQEIPFEVKENLTVQDVKDNEDTINNIRINAFKPALEFFNQVQSIKYYYNFNDIDIDRYNINGKFNQVFIAPREVNANSIDPPTWQNVHLIYTHGYGAVMSKVNSVTTEGQPDFVIKDIPGENNSGITLDNPRIYYGESTNDYAIVNTKIDEFDYPNGGEIVKNQYDGTAGINMSFGNKLLFAINRRNINFILSRDITPESKILINRNIVDRVKKIAPFLTYDEDPCVVIYRGRLYWIIDGYTTSNRYPFSQYENGINYIRNSVKVTVDALDGTTNFYIVDKNDPIALSYSGIFKGLFKDGSEMPSELREHLKYPEDMFNIQCKVLGKYHMTDPGVFFDGGDLWEVSQDQKQVNGDKIVNEAPYVVMKLPGEKSEEMVLTEYFNIRDKENMAALFGARMDKDNYGKLVLYKFPTQKTVYGPYMFKQKLNQDTAISKELSLWNKEGSQVQFGDTIIVPVKDSLLYIEPMYLRASGKNSIPEVKRIIVGYGEKTVLAESIDSALQQLFNYKDENNLAPVDNENKGAGIIPNEKLKEAKQLYDKAIESQKSGDWGSYGEYIKKLGEIINELNK